MFSIRKKSHWTIPYRLVSRDCWEKTPAFVWRNHWTIRDFVSSLVFTTYRLVEVVAILVVVGGIRQSSHNSSSSKELWEIPLGRRKGNVARMWWASSNTRVQQTKDHITLHTMTYQLKIQCPRKLDLASLLMDKLLNLLHFIACSTPRMVTIVVESIGRLRIRPGAFRSPSRVILHPWWVPCWTFLVVSMCQVSECKQTSCPCLWQHQTKHGAAVILKHDSYACWSVNIPDVWKSCYLR